MRGLRGLRRGLAFAAAALALAPAPAAADKPAPADAPRDSYSPYERTAIDEGVQKLGASVEPHPEGMVLEGVDVITLDVFEKRDPLPGVLMRIANWFHATTRPYIIEREVLLTPGQRWDQALVDETARNLRAFAQLSLVLCVPLRGSAPGRVRLLVITKDVWSLRLNSNYLFENGRLQYLLLQPSEENLLGTHQEILGNFVLDPATIALGGSYVLPRIAGSRVSASVSASAIVNRATGAAEGSYGSFSYGQPLYSTLAEWAWGANLSWDYEITRRFIGGEFTDFNPATGLCAPSAAGTPPDDPKSCRYRTDALSGSYAVTRSWGSVHKHDVTLGVSASRHVYTAFDLSAFAPAAQVAFVASTMPVTDTQIGPYAEYHDYSTRFVDVLDFEILGLTENFRRGHEILLHVAPVTTALRSTRNFVDVFAAAAYTVPFGDGLVRGIVQSNTELGFGGPPPPIPGRTANAALPDASIEAALHIVTPRFGIGRLVFDTHVLDRYQNYVNSLVTLGGDSRLRGYPAGAFIGSDFFAANLEYRSRPLELFAVQLAGAAFFDTGDAFSDFSKIRLKHSVGFGARLLFPQLERTVMRVDWGFPLTHGPGLPAAWPGDVTVTFGQAFGVPVIPTGN
jgi:hypothetical protein